MSAHREAIREKSRLDLVAALLIGVGLAMGAIPILLASLLVKTNLFVEIWNRMDEFWRFRGWN